MNRAIDRIIWMFYRRNKIAKEIPGFSADWRSFADASCEFLGYNKIRGKASLSNVRMGRFTYVGESNLSNCNIGAFCSIGREVFVGGLGSHPGYWLSTHPVFYSTLKQAGITFVLESKYEEHKQTYIGNDVWVGLRCVLIDGVTVADGAIIAAGAVVVSDVPPYAVVGGVPAKIIKYRFTKDLVDELLEWQWWNLPISILKRMAPSFISKREWTLEDIRRIKAETNSLM